LVARGEPAPEGGFTDLDWFASQILALELKQVESAERYGVIVLPPADHCKHGEATLIAGNRLTVNDTRTRCEGRYCRGNEEKTVS
jgi:hypothetical protein